MALPTISAGDLINKGTTGMPPNPELSVADLQAKFDELSLDVIVPKFQALVTALENASAGVDLGVTAPTGITASNKVKSVLDEMAVILLALKDKSDGEYDDLVSLFTGITAVSNVVDGLTTTIPTAKAITDFIQDIGGGDMLRAVYDTDNDGIVDNSEKLGGYSLDQLVLTANKTLYVSPTGSDTTGNGTSGSPYKTVAKCNSVTAKNLNGYTYTVAMASGTYTEEIVFTGFTSGMVVLQIQGNVTLNGSIFCINCSSTIQIQSPAGNTFTFTINNTINTNGAVASSNSFLIYGGSCYFVITSSYHGINAYGNSTCNFSQNVTINNSTIAVNSTQASRVSFNNNLNGTGNTIGLRVDCSEISYDSSRFTLEATNLKEIIDGGIITNDLYHSVTAVTWSGPSTTPTTSLCYRLGNLVRLDFVILTTTGISNEAIIGQLLPRFRPSVSTGYKMGGFAYDKPNLSSTDKSFGILCGVDTDGLIRIANYLGVPMYGASVAIEFIVP